MAHDDNGRTDRWVDERLATLLTLDGDDQWLPDARARLAAADARLTTRHSRRVRTAVAGIAAAAVFVSVPGTRGLAARCVEACVSASSRVSQLWNPDEQEVTRPAVIGASIGDLAPDLAGTDIHGAPVHLSSLRGRVVVVNFWATWCGPCRAEVPLLNDLQRRFGPVGVEVLGVSLDENGWEAISAFAAEERIGYSLALANDEVLAAFGGVNALPATFVVDASGRIVIKRVGVLREASEDLQISRFLSR